MRSCKARSGRRAGKPCHGAGPIREAVIRNRQDKLTALLHHLNIDVLRASFSGLKKTAAPGVDERTWIEYAEHLEANLLSLQVRVHTGAYRDGGGDAAGRGPARCLRTFTSIMPMINGSISGSSDAPPVT
jgi:hypothetical protein